MLNLLKVTATRERVGYGTFELKIEKERWPPPSNGTRKIPALLNCFVYGTGDSGDR